MMLEQRVIAVEMWEMRSGHSPDILFTDGLGPCVGMAFYSRRAKGGHLLHTTAEVLDYRRVVEELRSAYGNLRALHVAVTGCSFKNTGAPDLSIEELDDYIGQCRERVLGFLGLHFKRQNVQIVWTPRGESGELTLDLYTGDMVIRHHEINDDTSPL